MTWEETEKESTEKALQKLKEIKNLMRESEDNTPEHIRGVIILDRTLNELDSLFSSLYYAILNVPHIIMAKVWRESEQRSHERIKMLLEGTMTIQAKEEN